MTPQEQQMIDGLISRIRSTQVQNKDVQAEQHIQQGLAGFPDALYVLTQTVLVQQYGLEQATSQLNELKQQNQILQDQLQQAAQQPKDSGGSFLSHIFGGGHSQQSASPAPSQGGQYQPVNNPGYGSQGYPPPPPPPVAYPSQGYPQAYPQGGGGGMFGGGGGGGFLQGALQTAAGVAAGEMVFQGMEDLFHGFGGHGGGYGFGGSGGGAGETIINNYNDDDRGGSDRGSDRDFGDRDSGDRNNRNDSSFYNPSDDASRENFAGDSSGLGNDTNFAGTNDDFGSNDTLDDSSSFDNSSNDDFSSSDDNS